MKAAASRAGSRSMDFPETILNCLQKSFTYSGRASRAEFFHWFVVFTAVPVILRMLDSMGIRVEYGLEICLVNYALLIIPHLAIVSRRLHDINKSGWWQLTILMPILGPLIVLLWMLREGDNGPNRFGHDPFWPEVTILSADE